MQKNTNKIPNHTYFTPVAFKRKEGRYHYTLYAAGRYYSKENYRHETSQLRRLILEFKNTSIHDQLIHDIYNSVVEIINLDYKFDIIESIPPKLGERKDRFKDIVETLRLLHGTETLESCSKSVKESLKMLNLNKYQRQKNIENVFSITCDVRGKKVLIIDDVFTTGATLSELGSMFYKSGAKEVVFLVLGKTQRTDEKNEGKMLRNGFSLKLKSEYVLGYDNFYFSNEISQPVMFTKAYDNWITKLNDKMKAGANKHEAIN